MQEIHTEYVEQHSVHRATPTVKCSRHLFENKLSFHLKNKLNL